VRVRLIELGLSPAALFKTLAGRPGSVFMDSALVDRYRLGRWSFIAYDPLFLLSSRNDSAAFRIGKRLRWEDDNPFNTLRRTLSLFHVDTDPSWIPFKGGLIGYFGYELGRHVEKVPRTTTDDLQIPDMLIGFYDTVIAYDHIMEQWFVCHTDFKLRRPAMADRFQELKLLVKTAKQKMEEERGVSAGRLESNFTRDGYLRAVEKARQYIIAGDIYQVNLSQRFCATVTKGSPWDLYRRLRSYNAAPFAAFINAGSFHILSSSPERFLKVTGDRVETRPIKGTRPRGATPREDALFRAQLLASEKDHAELAMIVDLERNDLGRVCRYGTVRVSRHAQCESYARVHHLVSTVEGELNSECDVTDLLLSTFPGGSITGAPKIRAMEIIDEIEPNMRYVYCGAIGYIGFDGEVDLNIAIRTMIMNGNKVYFGAGGGVVYDSAPEMEYDETWDKAHAMIEALGAETG